MNNVQTLIDQQMGIAKWHYYDTALKRLVCKKGNEYRNILPRDNYSEDSAVLSSDPAIFACKFAHVKGYQQILALANEDGKIAIHDVQTRNRFGCEAHNNAIFDIAWMPKAMKLVTASGDHSASIFDVSNDRIKRESTFGGHIRSLKSVACRADDNHAFATGGRDGKIIVWDSRALITDLLFSPDILVYNTHSLKHRRDGKCPEVVSASSSVTGLIFQDYNTLISCGAGDGFIKVWDLRKTYYTSTRTPTPKCVLPYGGSTLRNGFSNLLLNSNATKLYASCLDNVIYVYNVATYNPTPIMKYTGHRNSTFYVKASLSPDNKYILSGSSDNKGYIWNACNSYPIVQLTGHEAEVTCVAWCEDDSNIVVTCSDDLKHKIWKIDPEGVLDKSHSTNRAVEVSCSPPLYIHTQKRKICSTHTQNYMLANRINNALNMYMSCHNDDEELGEFTNKKTKADFVVKRKLSSIDQDRFEKPTKRLKCLDDDNRDLLSDLPNFVIDGVAPHLNISPIKTLEKDWLTRLRLKRLPIFQLSKSSPSKIPKIDVGTSSKSKNKLGAYSSSQSPLLKYFKITSNPSQQCRSKSPNSISLSPI